MRKVLITRMAAVILTSALAAAAAESSDPSTGCDWTHFLGPNYNGSSPEKGLLREWPKEGPQILWRAKIKQGWSCPSVSGKDVFVTMTEFEPTGKRSLKEMAICLDAATGQQRWEYSWPVDYNNFIVAWGLGGVRSTPAVSDKCVYCMDPLFNLRCLDRTTGRPVWEKSLAPEFSFKKGMENKGYLTSPLVYKNVLIVHGYTGNKGKGNHFVYVLGFDAMTGKQLWINEDDDLLEKSTAGSQGESPLLITYNNEPCVCVSFNRFVRIIRLSDGKELSRFENIPPGGGCNGIPSLLIAENKVVTIPFTGFMVANEFDLANPSTFGKPAWKSPDYYGSNDYHNFVCHAGYLFGVNAYATNGNDVGGSKLELVCLDLKTGKRVWKEPGFNHGYSLITADGLLFVRSFQTLSLIEATPEGYKLKGKLEKVHSFEPRGVLDHRGLTDCVSPVLSRGCLYLRCPDELLCVKVSEKVKQGK